MIITYVITIEELLLCLFSCVIQQSQDNVCACWWRWVVLEQWWANLGTWGQNQLLLLDPLRTAKAEILSPTISAITQQLIELVRCSNHLRIRQRLLVSMIFFQFWVWGSLGGISQVLLHFLWSTFTALGANPMSQFFGSILETRLSSESLEP